MQRKTSFLKFGLGLLVLLAIAECLGVSIPGLDILFYLAIGWYRFVVRVAPQVTVRWDLIASATVYAIALVVGSQFFLRWLYRSMNAATDLTKAATKQWKWRWTLGGFLLVMLMFVSGMAAIGIAHQTTWLVRSPGPLHRRNERVHCAMNLMQIGTALELYRADHGGKFPDDLSSLITDAQLSGRVLVCPATHDLPAIGPTTQEAAANAAKPGHNSYIYLGKGMAEVRDPRPADSERAIVVELLENHDGEGMNVLFGDRHVQWLDRPAAEKLLRELGFERVESKETP